MLEDAQQISRQGKDIVIGYFEPHGRKDTMARTAGLEMVPTRSSTHGSAVFQEMDTDAISDGTRRFVSWMNWRTRTFPARLVPSGGKTFKALRWMLELM